jgi:thiol-disulfide isomerase/thioredoxin
MRIFTVAAGASLALILATGDTGDSHAGSRTPGAELIGRRAPEWTFDRWISSPPLSIESLRGKVVLLRWWTEGCHYCATTLPVLERVRARDRDSGLVVVGVYHPKPPREVSDAHVVAVAKQLGFRGPIAVDSQWSTLERYWLDGHPDRDWTSVSFLIDRRGVIRWVHGGGEYHPSNDPRHAGCAAQYREFEKALRTALADRGRVVNEVRGGRRGGADLLPAAEVEIAASTETAGPWR